MSKIFLEYLNEDNRIVNGYFELVNETPSYIEFESEQNYVKIPWNRVIKIKSKKYSQNMKGGIDKI